MNLSHPLELISHPLDGRILEALVGADAAFTGRQVHRLLKAGSPRGVQLGLDRLRRQGIVAAQPAGRAVLYRLNTDHLAAAHVLALAHLKHELLRRLRTELASWNPPAAAAYLFGSTARSDSTADSDVDMLLVRPRDIDDPDQPDWRQQVDALPRIVSAWTGNDTRVVEFAEDEARSAAVRRDSLLALVRDEGVHLAGDESVLTP